MSSLSQFAQSGKIKSIQRGIITIGTSSSSSSVTITAVDTSKSVLHYLGQSTSSYSSGYGSFGSAGSADAYLSLTNSTTITASRVISGTDITQYISYQIVEYY
jgi:hypothetical protein